MNINIKIKELTRVIQIWEDRKKDPNSNYTWDQIVYALAYFKDKRNIFLSIQEEAELEESQEWSVKK